MARADAEEDSNRGEQTHTGTHLAGREPGHDGQDNAADGRKVSEGAETKEEYEKRIASYAEAVLYFLGHPEAPLHPVVRAFIESLREEIEYEPPEGQQGTLN